MELPDDLEIIWLPTDSGVASVSTREILPGSNDLEEALNSLLITLHPKNQHRALYPSGSSGRPVEPTLGLYCPLEGGDCVVDATVRELAFQTGSEVLVLDAVQLAAGEWGAFGKGKLFIFPSSNNYRTINPSSRQSLWPPQEYTRFFFTIIFLYGI